MRTRNENALICDMAETYHIYDYLALPVKTAATLAAGLSPDSRIKRYLIGQKQTSETILLAAIADALNTLVWFKTKDGQRGVNRPASILKELTEDKEEYAAFDSIEAYEAARAERMKHGGV